MPEVKDKFCNQAYLSVTEAAANTLTFDQLLTGISIYEKVGWLISRMEYNIGPSSAKFAADTDQVQFGLSTSNVITGVGMENTPVIDTNTVARIDFGAAASGFLSITPILKNFADLPGGGLLVPPNPLYLFVKGANAPNAFTIKARMFYTVISLKTEDFWELVELRRMIGA